MYLRVFLIKRIASNYIIFTRITSFIIHFLVHSMSQIITNTIALKNKLNEIVTLRKKNIETLILYTKEYNDLLQKLELAKNTNDIELHKELEIRIAEKKSFMDVVELSQQETHFKIDELLTSKQKESYSTWIKSLEQLTTTNNNLAIDYINVEYIQCSLKSIRITSATNKLIIYPTLLLLEEKDNSFYIFPFTALDIKALHTSAIENTPQQTAQPISIEISIQNIYREILKAPTNEICNSVLTNFTNYSSLSKNIEEPSPLGIKKEYFERMVLYSQLISSFIEKLQKNSAFVTYTNNSSISCSNILLVDLLTCLQSIKPNSQTTSNESFTLMYLIHVLNGWEIKKYEEIIKLNSTERLSYYENLISSIRNHQSLPLYDLLKSFDESITKEYRILLYKYISLIAEADYKVSVEEEKAMEILYQKIVPPNNSNIELEIQANTEEPSIEELLYELYDLTGLFTVKQEINTLINLIKIKKEREKNKLPNNAMSLHLVFTGNPGTGKTTVARMVAKIYKNLGVLKLGHLIETDRSGMIAEYVGQTAIKVNKLVDSALNGVLFIDEAYAILTDDKDTYGKEAIATLLKRMEDDRDKLIVILAGYTDEMGTFIESNPGLKSRFNKYIHFPDYTATELYSIFISLLKKSEYTLQNDVIEKIKKCFEQEIALQDSNFGNGRYVINIFEKMIEKQANRLALDTSLSKEELTTFTIDDLPFY